MYAQNDILISLPNDVIDESSDITIKRLVAFRRAEEIAEGTITG